MAFGRRPNHFLGDFPNVKWKHIAPALPADLSGASVLDIGCNGGFYSIELKRRGASRVLGVDVDDRYLEQARFASQTLGLDIEFAKCSVYDVDSIPGKFDFVLFMGVFYHLRYPLFALDKVIKKVGGKPDIPDHGSRLSHQPRAAGGLSFLEHGDIQGPGFSLHVLY